MSNLVKRTLSAIILAPMVLYIILRGGYAYQGLVTIAFFIMFYEWVTITKKSEQKILWWIFGFFYIGFACFVLIMIERFRLEVSGYKNVPVHLLTVLLLIWTADIFSYIFGRSIGGPKLAPKISPGKTWSGAIGGIVACIGAYFIYNYSTDFGAGKVSNQTFYIGFAIFTFVPIISLIGDLFESYVKRTFGVKDSGSIIPGHGGLLDRLDGTILVMNVIGILYFILYQIKLQQNLIG